MPSWDYEPLEPVLISYPFPLSTGKVAALHLPKTLDPDDAERLAEFVLSLASSAPSPGRPGARL